MLNQGDILVSLRSWRLQDSKNSGHFPFKSTRSSVKKKKKKKYPAWIVNLKPQLFNIRFFGI